MRQIADDYLLSVQSVRPGDRLHRLICRLADTHIDDLTDERIEEIERLADSFRVTHADGARLEK